MTLQFDINETGTFNVVYDASISIPNTTATVALGKLTLNPPVGDYTIYNITVTNTLDSNCTYTYTPDIEVDCLAPCGCSSQNFSVLSVTNTSGSNYSVLFDACRVNPIHADIYDGGSLIYSYDVPVAASPFTIDLSSIVTNGTYRIVLSSSNCIGTGELNFSVVHNGGGGSTQKELLFVVNCTGVGVDFGNPANNHISNNQIQLITDALTGVDADAVDVIRLPFIWGEYNPSNGVYRNAQLSIAINWIRSLRPNNPPKIDLLFVPILGGNDSRIPSNELAVDNNGNLQDCTYNSVFTTVPSYYSNTATTLIGQALDSLLPYLQTNHGTAIRVIEFAAGQSEEHYMPYTSQYAGGQCGQFYSGIGDYSTGASLPAWRSYLLGRFGLGVLPFNINGSAHTAASAPIPNVGVTAGNNDNMNYSQQAYRELFRFYSQGIFGIWKRFHDKVKSLTSFKTGYVIADFLNEQGTKWIFHGGTIWLAMKYADQFYHTHNISPSEWEANLWGADVQLGSFPNQGKLPAIEFDNFDAGASGGGNLNTSHVSSVIYRFVKNGGKVVHAALGWTTNQMNQWKSLIKTIKNTIASPSFVLENRNIATTINVDSRDIFTNPRVYEQAWVAAGNTYGNAAYNASPVNIVIANNGEYDGFWYENTIPTIATIEALNSSQFNISNNGGYLTDTTPITYNAHGNTYKSYYLFKDFYIGESFTNLDYRNFQGELLFFRKIVVRADFFPTWDSYLANSWKVDVTGNNSYTEGVTTYSNLMLHHSQATLILN